MAERNFPFGVTAPTLPTSSGVFYGPKLKNPQIAGRVLLLVIDDLGKPLGLCLRDPSSNLWKTTSKEPT